MRKKLSALINKPDVPTGFTELEYLESSGTQWIKTDYIFTNQDDVSCVAKLIKVGSFWANLFGCLDEYGASLYFGWMNYGNAAQGKAAYGSSKNFQWDEDPALKKMNIQLSPDGNLYINNILIYTNTSNKNSFPAKYPASLFAINNKGAASWGQCSQRIFSFNIKRAETSVFTLVPVLDTNGIPCMFDKISRTCLYNKGNGTFGYKIKATGETVAPKST